MVLTHFNIFFKKKKENVLKWYKCIPFLPVCEIIKEILKKNWFPLLSQTKDRRRTWFFVLLSHFNICREKSKTKQKFYRTLKVNHTNVKSLLFAFPDLIKVPIIIHSKYFPDVRLWLAKSTRLIHHNQLLTTKMTSKMQRSCRLMHR